jgi:hypothetical protein
MRISRVMTNFLKSVTKLHITPTTIRKLIELEFKAAKARGDVTGEVCEAVRNSLGHSESTVERYYSPTAR